MRQDVTQIRGPATDRYADGRPATLRKRVTAAYIDSMKHAFLLALVALMPGLAQAQSAVDDWRAAPDVPIAAAEVDLEAFEWVARPVVVFADSPFDPAFEDQMALLAERVDELVERDVVVIYDTDPDTPSAARLALRPRGFMLALVGKDGQLKLRKPRPWDVREISRSIDKMPMREREIEARRGES